jgi:hypothetical protein
VRQNAPRATKEIVIASVAADEYDRRKSADTAINVVAISMAMLSIAATSSNTTPRANAAAMIASGYCEKDLETEFSGMM